MKPLYTPEMRRWLGGYEPQMAAQIIAGKERPAAEVSEQQRKNGAKGKLKAPLSKVAA